MTPPWIPDEPAVEPAREPVRVLPPRYECTEAERAYLNAILDGGTPHKEIERLRVRVAAERLDQAKRRAIVRAWADSILACERRNDALEGVDLGGYDAPLYRALEKEAEALAESERNK